MKKPNVGILGSGDVGKALAAGFAKKGYRVTIGSRMPAKLEAWKRESGADVALGTFEEAADFGELVVFAVKGDAAVDLLKTIGERRLAGKTVLDTTNPIAPAAPEDGVIAFFTGGGESLLEKLQRASPQARFVKAWNSVGSAAMVDPDFPGGPPTMFICGDDEKARREATAVLKEFGWDTADMGKARAARAIEPLCVLWCIPGFLSGDWNHAFKLLRKT